MQALCQWDVQSEASEAVLAEVFEGLDAPPQAIPHATRLVRDFWHNAGSVDERLSRAAEHWSLDRMSPVERNAMRVAVVELLAGEVPSAVSLDEAIEIVKEFGGKESPRFVNGVLNRVLEIMRIERDEARGAE